MKMTALEILQSRKSVMLKVLSGSITKLSYSTPNPVGQKIEEVAFRKKVVNNYLEQFYYVYGTLNASGAEYYNNLALQVA